MVDIPNTKSTSYVLVVVHNFDVARFIVAPYEAQTVLLVDSDRMSPCAFFRERFEGIAGRAKIPQASGLVKLDEFSEPRPFDRLEFAARPALKYLLRFRAPERPDHGSIIYR